MAVLSRLLLGLMLALAATACSDSSEVGFSGGADVAKSLNCDGWVDVSDEPLVAEGGPCRTPDGKHLVVDWFDSTEDRDKWVKAEGFEEADGVHMGDRWVSLIVEVVPLDNG